MNKEVSLVLGSGGARGMAHIGVIEELESQGYQIRSITGVSIGALVGGAYANGKLGPFKEWMVTLDRMKIFQLMDFSLSWQGFIKGEKVFEAMHPFIGGVKIEDLDIPFQAVATDLLNEKEVIFKSGSLSEAVRASVSIPTVLQPKEIKGVKLVDGGVLNPLPIAWADKDHKILVVVDLNSQKKYVRVKSLPDRTHHENELFHKFKTMFNHWQKDKEKGETRQKELGFFDLLTSSFSLTQDMLSNMILDKYKPDVLVEIPRKSCDTMEFDRAAELILYGRKAAKEALKKAEKEIQV